MLDAIGKTVVSVGQKLAAMPEEERPGLVSVTIVTDGYENHSKEYDWKTIRAMIKEQKEKYSWMFAFIGANIDVEKTVYDLGIDKNMSATYTCTADGIESVYTAMSVGTISARNIVSVSGSVADAAASYTCALNTIQ